MSRVTARMPKLLNPDFHLWFPRIETSGGQVHCTFDAVRAGAVLLHQGTEETCRRFLEGLGITVGVIRCWNIERVCTPFFTDLPDAPDWRDRYRISWRVTVRATARGPVPRPGSDPIAVVATDKTAGTSPGRVPGDEVCEVLAVEVAEPGTGTTDGFLRALCEAFPEHLVSVQDAPEMKRAVRVGRIRIGRFMVEDELERLDAITQACAEKGFATNIPRFEFLRARVG